MEKYKINNSYVVPPKIFWQNQEIELILDEKNYKKYGGANGFYKGLPVFVNAKLHDN